MEKIERVNDYEIIVDNIKFIKDISKPPAMSFHIGDWVIAKEKYFRPHSPRLITSIGIDLYNAVQYNYFDDFNKTEKNGCDGKYLRHATSQEIEQHLRKICDEKGYREGIKFHPINDPLWIQTIGNKFWYDSSEEALHTIAPKDEWNTYCSDPVVYSKGKFAEVVPEKKKLPKTKEEAKVFLEEYIYKNNLFRGIELSSFLNDYEDT